MSPGDRRKIRQALIGLAPIPDAELDTFLGAIRVVELAPKESFVQAGERSDRLGLVLEGLFRVYYPTADGRECVCHFHPEGRFLGAYSALIRDEPSRTTTEAVEPSRVAWIRYPFLRSLFERHPAWDRLGRKIAEGLYVEMVAREESLMSLDAKARLAELEREYPGVIPRVSKAQIAAYLGIRPETLSRLLRRVRK